MYILYRQQLLLISLSQYFRLCSWFDSIRLIRGALSEWFFFCLFLLVGWFLISLFLVLTVTNILLSWFIRLIDSFSRIRLIDDSCFREGVKYWSLFYTMNLARTTEHTLSMLTIQSTVSTSRHTMSYKCGTTIVIILYSNLFFSKYVRNIFYVCM